MVLINQKKNAATFLYIIGLLSCLTAGVITVTVAPAQALTLLGQYQIDIENGTPGTRGPYYGGKFVADLLTNEDPVGNPALISGFGATSYWLSNAPGSIQNFNVVLLPTGTTFGSSGPELPDGPTNNLYNKNFPTVDGKGFAFAYLDSPTASPATDDSYQIFSKSSEAPGGFSYYGCWGVGECVPAKVEPVPGPLSLLGLGAVLGYSRKLRKRFETKAASRGVV